MHPIWSKLRAVLLAACLLTLPAVARQAEAAAVEVRRDRAAADAAGRGAALQMDGRYAEAALAFREAIAASPRAVGAYEGLAEAEFRQGRFAEALAAYRTLMSRYPYAYLAEPHRQVGLIELRAGLFREAVEDLREAVALDPTDWLGFYWLGHASVRLGDEPAARDAWHRVIALNPDFQPARDQLRKLDAQHP